MSALWDIMLPNDRSPGWSERFYQHHHRQEALLSIAPLLPSQFHDQCMYQIIQLARAGESQEPGREKKSEYYIKPTTDIKKLKDANGRTHW
jgi:hypothetical protein